MSGRRWALLAVTAAVALAACTGDDSTPATTASAVVVVGTLPSTASETRTSRPTDVLAGPARAPVPQSAMGRTWTPAALAAPTAGHQWLVVGSGREAPGAPSRVALALSDDGTAWRAWSLVGPDGSGATAILERPDGTTLIGGAVDTPAGPRPTMWRLTDATVEPYDALSDVPGTVTAMTVDAAGAEVLLLATAGDAAGPAVATRDADGWQVAVLPGTGEAAAAGIAIQGSTVVVTGATVEGDGPAHATAWRSVDGGATFSTVDTPALTAPDHETALGPVVATGTGFAAATCSPVVGGLALSGDGTSWVDVAIRHPRGVVSVVGGDCATIAADPDGGLWLGSGDRDPVVARVDGELVDRLGVPVRPPGTVFQGSPLVAASNGTVVAVVPQPGGAASTTANAATLATDLELDVAMPATSGLPAGHESPVALTALDDRGTTLGLATYPVVTDDADGSYRWTTHETALRLDATGAVLEAPGDAPIGPDGSLGGIVTTANGQEALATVADVGDEQPAAWPLGDVVVSRRPNGGAWSARRVVAGGDGRQAVNAVVVATPTGTVVGVGEEQVADSTSGEVRTTPLVLSGEGTTFAPIAVVDAPEGVQLRGACPGPAGTVVAVGVGPAGPVVVSIDPVGGTADVLAAAALPAGAAPERCAGDGRAVLLAGPRTLLGSADGRTFEPVEGRRAGEIITAVAAGPGGFAVVGTTPAGDGFALAGRDPGSLRRLAAPTLEGPGSHVPTGAVVGDRGVLVLGLGDGAPIVWPADR